MKKYFVIVTNVIIVFIMVITVACNPVVTPTPTTSGLYLTDSLWISQSTRPSPTGTPDVQLTRRPDTIENLSEYETLKVKLDNVLDDRRFGRNIDEILSEILYRLYVNYTSFEKIFALIGVPSATEYITVNYIDLLDIDKNINAIKFLSDEEWSDYKLDEWSDGESMGGFDLKTNNIYMRKKWLEINYDYFVEGLFHEIYHSSQEGRYDGLYDAWDIMKEGGATSAQSILRLSRYDLEFSRSEYAVLDPNKENHYFFINGLVQSGSKYALFNNFYEKLRIMTGYSAIEQYKKEGDYLVGDSYFNKIAEIVDGKYGNKTLENFFECARYIELMEDYSSYMDINDFFDISVIGKLMDSITEMENIILNCLKERIVSADSRKKVMDFYNYYRFYKSIYLIRYMQEVKFEDGGDSNNIDYTHEVYSVIGEIDEILTDKLISYKVLPEFSSDPKLNKIMIKGLVYTDRSTVRNMVSYFPKNLYDACYKCIEKDSSMELTVTDLNFKHGVSIIFNTKEIISVTTINLEDEMNFDGFKMLFCN